MLMLYDIRSFNAESEMRTLLLEFSESVYEDGGDVINGTTTYESVSKTYCTDLQESINSEFRYYINSAVGRAMLCFCGCTEYIQEEIVDGLSVKTNTTDFIANIQNLVKTNSDEGDNIASIESRANVREMAWDKMVAWRMGYAPKMVTC